MKLGLIVKWSFITSFIITLIGAYLKITHWRGAENLLIVGTVAMLVFIVTAIYEVRTSKRIGNTEKTFWTLALVFFSAIAGLAYVFIARRKISTAK